MARWPAIKHEWLKLLQGEPVLSPLGRPETLVYLMDATLTQLGSGLHAGKGRAWLKHCVPVAGSVHQYCACGLNPLLKYFSTGELALRAGAGPELADVIDKIILRFRTLAQHEVDSLCSLCQHPDWQGCESPRKPATIPPLHPA